MRYSSIFSFLLLLCVVLMGCGGGGSNGPTVIPAEPQKPGANQAPSITSVSPASPVEIASGEHRTISVAATDPDSDPLTYQWQNSGGTIQQSTEKYQCEFTAPTTSTPVTCTVRVDVSDDHSHTTSAVIVFNVAGATAPTNDPPEIASVTADPASITAGQTSALTVVASDPDGDTLSYVWFSDAGSIKSQSGTTATWEAPTKAGTYNVTVSVSDGKNAAVLGTVQITVGGGGGTPVVNGLTATYIKNSGSMAHPDLSKGTVVATRTDPAINFDWDQKSPLDALITNAATGDANDFGVRWTGHVLCDAAGAYVFRAKYDDGMRVWITNDQNQSVLVIDGWTTGPVPVLEGSITLQGSKWYPIRVDFFEDQSNAYAKLSWVPPGSSEQIVPSNKLRVD